MKNSFKNLVKKMDALQEDQQGKLRGGFSAFSMESSIEHAQNVNVNVTDRACGCKCDDGTIIIK